MVLLCSPPNVQLGHETIMVDCVKGDGVDLNLHGSCFRRLKIF